MWICCIPTVPESISFTILHGFSCRCVNSINLNNQMGASSVIFELEKSTALPLMWNILWWEWQINIQLKSANWKTMNVSRSVNCQQVFDSMFCDLFNWMRDLCEWYQKQNNQHDRPQMAFTKNRISSNNKAFDICTNMARICIPFAMKLRRRIFDVNPNWAAYWSPGYLACAMFIDEPCICHSTKTEPKSCLIRGKY